MSKLVKVWGITGYKRPFKFNSVFIRQSDLKLVENKQLEWVEMFKDENASVRNEIRPVESLACNLYLSEEDAYKAAERLEKARKENPGKVIPICHFACDMAGNVVTKPIS